MKYERLVTFNKFKALLKNVQKKSENLVENGQNCTLSCQNSIIPLEEKYQSFFCSDCPSPLHLGRDQDFWRWNMSNKYHFSLEEKYQVYPSSSNPQFWYYITHDTSKNELKFFRSIENFLPKSYQTLGCYFYYLSTPGNLFIKITNS